MAIGLWLSIYQIVRSGQHISRRDFLAGHPETHCARRRHHDQIRLGLSHNLRNKERHHPQLAMTVVATVALSHEIPFPSCSGRLCTSGRGCVKTHGRRVLGGRFTLPLVAIVDPGPF